VDRGRSAFAIQATGLENTPMYLRPRWPRRPRDCFCGLLALIESSFTLTSPTKADTSTETLRGTYASASSSHVARHVPLTSQRAERLTHFGILGDKELPVEVMMHKLLILKARTSHPTVIICSLCRDFSATHCVRFGLKSRRQKEPKKGVF
jgi:hypothetical protein